MGYTHYWQQLRDFTADEWEQITVDIGALLKDVQHVQGITLANAEGTRGTSPHFWPNSITFNGTGDDSHETFALYYKRRPVESWQTKDRRGCNFCKTARKPYDLAVTAALCYLATTFDPPAFTASSDGDGSDWLAGLEEARRAIPRVANVIDIPRGILEDDRWCCPHVSVEAHGYDVKFCVDGHGYVMKPKTRESYRFATHVDLALFLDSTKRATFRQSCVVQFGTWRSDEGRVENNIWRAMGSFDAKRRARIARSQATVLNRLFPVPAENAHQPPLYVRPGEILKPARASHDFTDLLNVVDATTDALDKLSDAINAAEGRAHD